MTELYIGLVAFGALYAIVTVLFGDVVSEALDGALDFLSVEGPGWFQAPVLIGGLTAFGGAGWLVERTTPLGGLLTVLCALGAAVILSAVFYFAYVRPMERSEVSNSFSMRELTGAIAEVLVPIPATGYGEVMLTVGASRTNQIAASFDGEAIEEGSRVVVVEIRDDTLYVSRFN